MPGKLYMENAGLVLDLETFDILRHQQHFEHFLSICGADLEDGHSRIL
jgi:hypothetical protein